MDKRNWEYEELDVSSVIGPHETIPGKVGRKFIVRAPSGETEFPIEYLSLPKVDIPKLVAEYTSKLEVEPSSDWCKCEWLIHPDDVDIEEGYCRDCNHKKGTHDPEGPCLNGACECRTFKGRRKRPGTPSNGCPIHSKEGRVLAFFEWVFKEENVKLESMKKTPLAWLFDVAYQRFLIRDNDGWTSAEWEKQEEITRDEFERRLARCTLERQW